MFHNFIWCIEDSHLTFSFQSSLVLKNFLPWIQIGGTNFQDNCTHIVVGQGLSVFRHCLCFYAFIYVLCLCILDEMKRRRAFYADHPDQGKLA